MQEGEHFLKVTKESVYLQQWQWNENCSEHYSSRCFPLSNEELHKALHNSRRTPRPSWMGQALSLQSFAKKSKADRIRWPKGIFNSHEYETFQPRWLLTPVGARHVYVCSPPDSTWRNAWRGWIGCVSLIYGSKKETDFLSSRMLPFIKLGIKRTTEQKLGWGLRHFFARLDQLPGSLLCVLLLYHAKRGNPALLSVTCRAMNGEWCNWQWVNCWVARSFSNRL